MADLNGIVLFVEQTGDAAGSSAPAVEAGQTALVATADGLMCVSDGGDAKWFLDKPQFVPNFGIGTITDSWQALTDEIIISSDIGTENGCNFKITGDIYGVDTGSEYRVNQLLLAVFVNGSQWGPWNIITAKINPGDQTEFRQNITLSFYANPDDSVYVKARVSNTDYAYENVGLASVWLRRDYYLD